MIGLSLVGAAGVVHTAYAQTELLLVLALTLSATGILAAIPIFWSLPTAFHTGSAAAAGIGAIARDRQPWRLRRAGVHRRDGGLQRRLRDPVLILAALLVVGCVLTLSAQEAKVAEAPPGPAPPAPDDQE